MLSPTAMAEAATAAGLFHWNRGKNEIPLWHAEHYPGNPGLPLDSPYLVETVAGWLVMMVGASAEPETHRRYYEAARLLLPETVLTGIAFIGPDTRIACAMVALEKWSMDYARAVLRDRGAWA